MKKLIIMFLAITVFSILSFNQTYSCPKCNADFKQELLDKRANTLGGQELLEAIKNQDGGNSVVLPVKYINNDASVIDDNTEMITDGTAEDNSIDAFILIKIFFAIWFMRG